MDIDYHGTVHVTQALSAGFHRAREHTSSISPPWLGSWEYLGIRLIAVPNSLYGGYTDARARNEARGITVSCVYPPIPTPRKLAWENQYKPFETRTIAGSDKPLSADAVAESILRDIRKDKIAIVPGAEAKLIYFAATRLGGLVYPLMDILVRQASKKKAAIAAAHPDTENS